MLLSKQRDNIDSGPQCILTILVKLSYQYVHWHVCQVQDPCWHRIASHHNMPPPIQLNINQHHTLDVLEISVNQYVLCTSMYLQSFGWHEYLHAFGTVLLRDP